MLLHFIWNLAAFILALGILITVHEYGHFLAARFFKVKVERFSIGFGPVLWKWRDKNDTEYVISAILFGGYVKLFGGSEGRIKTDREHNTFDCKHIWEKSIIIASGSIFNFLFSILSYVLVFMIGQPCCKPIIYSIIPNSIIAQSNIEPGVEIKSINNVQTNDWEEVRLEIFNSIGKKEITITTVPTNNTYIKTYTINVDHNWFNESTNVKDPIIALGIVPFNSKIIPILSEIQPNSAAHKAGLKIGDKILAIDDKTIVDWESFIITVKDNPNKIFKITIERKNKIINLNLTPNNKKYLTGSNQIREFIGVIPKIIIVPSENTITNRYGLSQSILQACKKTWKFMCLTVNALIKLVTGNIKIINLSGPIAIAQGAGESAQSGVIYYLMFLSLISINLGIINLLPLPVLDGGYLLFLIIEKIQGKSISKRIQKFGYIMGFIVLILTMCLALFNDISRLW